MDEDDSTPIWVIVIILAAILFFIVIPVWNRSVLETNYTIVTKLTLHDEEKGNHLKYRVKCGGFDDGIVFYTDSVYKPGDTLYLRK